MIMIIVPSLRLSVNSIFIQFESMKGKSVFSFPVKKKLRVYHPGSI